MNEYDNKAMSQILLDRHPSPLAVFKKSIAFYIITDTASFEITWVSVRFEINHPVDSDHFSPLTA